MIFFEPKTTDRFAEQLLQQLSSAVVALDEHFAVLWLNEAAQALMEVSARRANKRTIGELIRINSDGERKFLDHCLQKALDEHRPFSQHGLPLCLGSGRVLRADCRVTPLDRAVDGACLVLEMVAVDNHLHLSRDGELMELESASRSLIRGVAHEVKNPLGGIRGAAQLLERELPKQELTEYTQIIISEADRLQGLVDRMLGPRSQPRFRMTSIHELLERVRTLVRADAPDSIRIQRDYDPSLPEFSADPEMLIQALLNLVGNAREALNDASAKGGTITLRTRAQHQCVIGSKTHRMAIQVDVIDDGPGVPPELRKKLFYPMVTGRSEGTGLGLSIAQSLINHHRGLIEFESRPGHTVFSLYLPLDTRVQPDEEG